MRVVLSMVNADPPISAFVTLPSTVGMVPTRHCPAAPGTSESSIDGIHAPDSTEATLPLPSARFHPFDHVGSRVLMSPSSIIFCQYSMNVRTPASPLRSTVTVLPSDEVWNGRPPASQIIASKKLASPASAAIYTPMFLSFFAAR